MNYKNILILLSIFLLSCVKEIDITEFSEYYSGYESELRIEAIMLPHENSAIVRIDQSLPLNDTDVFDCVDNNGNWVGTSCSCSIFGTGENENCPDSTDAVSAHIKP